MEYSKFNHRKDNSPLRASSTWQEFTEQLLPHRYDLGSKMLLPAISPALYDPGDKRGNTNVTGLSSWWGDFDGQCEEVALETVAKANSMGVQGLAYTTFSHHSKPYCFRIVLALDRIVLPEEWSAVWHALNDMLGGHCDPKCVDLSRIYFTPAAPPGTESANWSVIFPGDKPLKVDDLLSPKVAPLENLSRREVAAITRSWRRSSNAFKIFVGEALHQVCQGVAFAEPGDIDNTIFKTTSALASEFPDASPDSIGALFAPSLQLMALDHPAYAMTSDQVAEKFRRHLKAKDVEAASKGRDELAHAKALNKRALGRETAYTHAELNKVAPWEWIIQKNSTFYIRVLDHYKGPYVRDEVYAAASVFLAPAASVVSMNTMRGGEAVPKSLGKLVQEYGTVADKVVIDLSAQRSYFDSETSTLVEAPCPRRNLKAEYSPLVDEFLRVFAGERYDLLCDWLAACLDTSKPITALFLIGAPATGKSFLAVSAAKCWHAQGIPTPLEEALGGFNDALLSCPVVLADEMIPRDHRGNPKHQELKAFVQAKQRKLKRKFMPVADLIGAPRVIVNANNESVLATEDSMTNYDLLASMDRLLCIYVQDAAAGWLRDHPEHLEWVDNDTIGKHIVHLFENRKWTPNGRFQVHHQDVELQAKLSMGSGIRGSLGQWFLGYLQSPAKVENATRTSGKAFVEDGHLYVNIDAMVHGWEFYVGNARCPPTGKLARALEGMSVGSIERDDTIFRRIDSSQLYACANHTTIMTRQAVDRALATNTLRLVKNERTTHTR